MRKTDPGRSFIRRHLWKLLGAVVLAALLWAVVPRVLLGPVVSVIPVVQRDFIQSVVASGRVETPHRVEIGSQLTGTVVRVPVSEGQDVRAGDVLIELDAAELSASVEQAENAVEQAQARIRQLHEVQAPVAEQTVRQAQATLDHARAQHRRNEDLFEKGYIGSATRDESRKNVELADAQLQAAQRQLASSRVGGSEYAVAETALATARSSAAVARARLSYATIAAPLDGTLISRGVERGDVVQPGRTLMTLSPAGVTQLVVQIDEKNLALLSAGQRALASADAYPGQRFAATLAYINPAVNPQTGAVEVKLDVAEPPPVLRQDMTVSVEIEVAQRAAAVLVATDAVRDLDGRSPWVYRVAGGRVQRTPIRIGLRSAGYTEVLDGLAAGDRVVPGGAPDLADGSRVRARDDSANDADASGLGYPGAGV